MMPSSSCFMVHVSFYLITSFENRGGRPNNSFSSITLPSFCIQNPLQNRGQESTEVWWKPSNLIPQYSVPLQSLTCYSQILYKYRSQLSELLHPKPSNLLIIAFSANFIDCHCSNHYLLNGKKCGFSWSKAGHGQELLSRYLCFTFGVALCPVLSFPFIRHNVSSGNLDLVLADYVEDRMHLNNFRPKWITSLHWFNPPN